MSRITFCAAAVCAAAGCAIPQVPSRTVYEDPVNFVRLELDANVLPEWPPGHFTHPARFSHEQIRRVLMGLTVQEHRTALQRWLGGEPRRLPMFRDAEITILVPQLVEALRLAKENERITYYLSQPQTSIKRIITSGGLYVRGTELHFILGNWQTLYGIPAYGMIYDRRYPMNPIISKGFDLFFDLDHARVQQTTSIWDSLLANTKDELVIDLAIVFPGQAV
ncbi:MAG: hypothetical protein GDA66_13795 [Nitrospira sp. CR1.2]|nr:hypothetical protein [Nitrospira sp. CR1.2]